MKRFPYWLSRSVKFSKDIDATREVLCGIGVNTVCQKSQCPNIHECFSKKRCTFLILGSLCTRRCGFCAVEKNIAGLERTDSSEISKILEAVGKLGMKDIVITSVTRDDMDDGGAMQFADCINMLRLFDSQLHIETLVPDFLGNILSIEKVVSRGPDIFSHNIETVPVLYSRVRPGADYKRSLGVLKHAKEIDSSVITKSSLMVGLGETKEEVFKVMLDIKEAGCDIITIGQYLRPNKYCLSVQRFLEPEEFLEFSGRAADLGFKKYYCGPFVRSSYNFERS